MVRGQVRGAPRRSPRSHALGGQVSPVRFKRPVTPKPFRRSSRQQTLARQSGNKQKSGPGRQKRSSTYLRSITVHYSDAKRSTYTRLDVIDAIILKLHTLMPNGCRDRSLAVTTCYDFMCVSELCKCIPFQ